VQTRRRSSREEPLRLQGGQSRLPIWRIEICEGAKEDKSGWASFLQQLVDRGLTGVQLIISDACRGLIESAAEYLPEARWQRCMVHFYRNVFSHMPTTKFRDVSHMRRSTPRWTLR
jgi:transposase-like protein